MSTSNQSTVGPNSSLRGTAAGSTAADYDDMPYQSVAYAASSPDRIAAVAHLFGLAAPRPETARVLELGCASGGNILPFAMRFPEARLLGIDLSRGQVASGQARIDALGLSNIEVRHGDIVEIDLPEASFDYLVVHGVWSWIPASAQEAVFAIAQRCLVPGGLAYISYNTFPGWNMRKTVRDLTTYHAGTEGAPKYRVARARWLLDKLGKMPDRGVYSQLLKNEAELNAKQPDSYILGEFLADHNQPVYFHEFAERFQAHGLAYLCEADIASSVPDVLDSETAQVIRDISGGNGLAAEQYMDFFTGRQFRRSILVKPRSEAPIERRLALPHLADLHIRSDWKPDPEAIENVERKWVLKGQSREWPPMEDAILRAVAQEAPNSVAIRDLLAAMSVQVGAKTEDDIAKLLILLFRLTLNPGIDLTFLPFIAGKATDPKPEVSALVRLEAQSGQSWLSGPYHAPVSIGAHLQGLLSLVDGTRDAEDLESDVACAIAEGKMRQRHEQGAEAVGIDLDAAAQRDLARTIVTTLLTRLEAGGLLLPVSSASPADLS